MFLPYFISWVVVATIMMNIFGDHSVLNSIVTAAGGEKISIYSNTALWPVTELHWTRL